MSGLQNAGSQDLHNSYAYLLATPAGIDCEGFAEFKVDGADRALWMWEGAQALEE